VPDVADVAERRIVVPGARSAPREQSNRPSAKRTGQRERSAWLIAVDGVSALAIADEARAARSSKGRGGAAGISRWDASGIFHELTMADDVAGKPSARTLMLLYAADLAFRLRWEIRPALAEGRTVVAAPYVDTAIAFGRAVGLPPKWLANLFQFAPKPSERRIGDAAAKRGKKTDGFVEFSFAWMAGNGASHRDVEQRAAEYFARRARRP
jgi:hypothetical protein